VGQRGNDTSLAERRLSSALDAVPQGVVLFDQDGVIVHRNKAAATYLAARHEEALVAEAIQGLAGDVTSGREIAPSRTVDLFGPPRRTLNLRAVAFGRDQDSSALVIIDDVTDRRRLEGVRRDFVANISHELKTPVGAIGLLAETLVAEDDPAVAQRLAGRLLSEAFRVGRTIDDLLELSQIETGESMAREPLDVASVVDEAVARVSGAAEQRGIALDLAGVQRGLTVSADRRQLVSAVYNLLDNAVKYSDSGSPVAVGVSPSLGTAEIEVRDEGPGIPSQDLERVFERFYRVDRARSRESGGTGLGLAIVRHVANNHAGEVRVSSREGEGSTFTLRLPLAGGGGARDESRMEP